MCWPGPPRYGPGQHHMAPLSYDRRRWCDRPGVFCRRARLDHLVMKIAFVGSRVTHKRTCHRKPTETIDRRCPARRVTAGAMASEGHRLSAARRGGRTGRPTAESLSTIAREAFTRPLTVSALVASPKTTAKKRDSLPSRTGPAPGSQLHSSVSLAFASTIVLAAPCSPPERRHRRWNRAGDDRDPIQAGETYPTVANSRGAAVPGHAGGFGGSGRCLG